MEKNITFSITQNRDENSNKNTKNLNLNNGESIENFNIVFKHKEKKKIYKK